MKNLRGCFLPKAAIEIAELTEIPGTLRVIFHVLQLARFCSQVLHILPKQK